MFFIFGICSHGSSNTQNIRLLLSNRHHNVKLNWRGFHLISRRNLMATITINISILLIFFCLLLLMKYAYGWFVTIPFSFARYVILIFEIFQSTCHMRHMVCSEGEQQNNINQRITIFVYMRQNHQAYYAGGALYIRVYQYVYVYGSASSSSGKTATKNEKINMISQQHQRPVSCKFFVLARFQCAPIIVIISCYCMFWPRQNDGKKISKL